MSHLHEGGINQRKWVFILHCDVIVASVINTGVKYPILLAHEEEASAEERRGGPDQDRNQGFVHIYLHGLSLGVDKLHRPLEGSGASGRRLIAQSYGR